MNLGRNLSQNSQSPGWEEIEDSPVSLELILQLYKFGRIAGLYINIASYISHKHNFAVNKILLTS